MNLTVQQALQQAVEAHKAGRLRDAELLYRAILQVQPKHPDANHNLGVLAVSLNKREVALPLFRVALEAKPGHGQFCASYIGALIEDGQLETAKQVLEQGKQKGLPVDVADTLTGQLTQANALHKTTPLESRPEEAEIRDLVESYHQGRYDIVQSSAGSLLQRFPEYQPIWKVLGAGLQQAGKLHEAVVANEAAVRLEPNDAEAHYNLGVTLRELDRLEDAEASYGKAIALNPGYAEAHNNRGIVLLALGRVEDSDASFRKAIALRADFAEAHLNLGKTLQELGKLEEAQASYRRAIELKPNFAEAHFNLGLLYFAANDFAAALDSATRALNIKPTFREKALFVASTGRIKPKVWQLSLAKMVSAALLDPWGMPSDISVFACRLLRTEPAFMQMFERFRSSRHQDSNHDIPLSPFPNGAMESAPLLHAMLASGPIADDELEEFFAALRAQLLKAVNTDANNAHDADSKLSLHCFLAQQCFINEYVYFQTADEINDSELLRDRLAKALEQDEAIPPAWVVAVACYFPLYSINGSEKLLQQDWPANVKAVLRQQIEEHLAEVKLRAAIPVLTDIDNPVSLVVQAQYEEHPYPRWTSLPRELSQRFLNSHIRHLFPSANFRPMADEGSCEILIAGCGTGQHPIGTAQAIKGAKILAVDLSLTSLAYAKRKTQELGIDSIDYARADLLKLTSYDRTFDVIESCGVLHHLEDPFEGWKVLLSLLRPNGLMRLGFYSELARRNVVKIRSTICQEGVGASAQDIRNYRQRLLKLKHKEEHGFILTSSDFFSVSGCRDLLFHVQEHRMTLDSLNEFLKVHDLNFLGFEIDRSVKRAYESRFANDPAATNLGYWRIFEEENPDTFAGMYQFWVQKR